MEVWLQVACKQFVIIRARLLSRVSLVVLEKELES
jgi:hypothetical protein